ncbi:MAG TPA: efflux RND transporter periplasmic adaptor subunit [Candidatus Binatia bacterium]|nr:efflux RND transporter periplasmic adaptor subunit [Candidatus Binatia bacterium]
MSERSKARRGIGVAALAAAAGVAFWGGRAILRAQQGEQDSPPAAVAAPAGFPTPGIITALGRLEPKDGVIRVSGPSRFAVVIAELLVDDGDTVKEGEPIAVLDSHAQEQATVERLEAELENSRREYARRDRLHKDGIVSASELDEWQTKMTTVQADLQRAKAELELSVVRAPISGQVLEVHARAGEKVGPDGIAEIGRTDAMYAIAEVYETDIARIRLGQRAVVTSPALPKEAHGTVDRIGLKIGKKDVLDTDPAADTDARVVEVEIRLDDPKQVAGLTNLRVDVAIASAE